MGTEILGRGGRERMMKREGLRGLSALDGAAGRLGRKVGGGVVESVKLLEADEF